MRVENKKIEEKALHALQWSICLFSLGEKYSLKTHTMANPFDIKRSAGVGVRIFMPAFGLLGIDFGYGFDADNQPGSVGPSGWQTHFIIGQRF